MTRPHAIALLVAASFDVSLFAQATWTQVTPAVSPPLRTLPAIVFDSQRSVIVMHGGAAASWWGTPWLSDTWEWNGVTWTLRASQHVPPAISFPVMAYDSVRGRTVLVGAGNGNTWEWDGVDWHEIVASPAPPAPTTWFGERSMGFDSARTRTVWVGAVHSFANAMETWEWDGAGWQQKATLAPVSTAPSPHASFVFDSASSRMLLTGGCGTWEWDGTSWAQVLTGGAGGMANSMYFDSVNDRFVVLHAGGEAQLWNGVYWIWNVPAAAPTHAPFAGYAYDIARHVAVRYGGFAPTETWERSAAHFPSSQTIYGTGCGNPSPALSLDSVAPTIGSSVSASITNASLGIAFVAWGTSSSTWGTVPLPLALDPFGFEGCSLLQNGDLVLDAACTTTSWNTARHSLAIPCDYVLVGLHLYAQAWTLQPGFNTNGIVTSNAIAITIGDI
jgi:hypothetical protein